MEIRNLTASWKTQETHSEHREQDVIPIETNLHGLSNCNLAVPRGALCVIVGAVGSGKSTLLQAILSELHLEEGSVGINGKIAYVEQEPWTESMNTGLMTTD